MSNFRGNIVPGVVTGGGANQQGNAFADMMNAVSVKALKDLDLDLNMNQKK